MKTLRILLLCGLAFGCAALVRLSLVAAFPRASARLWPTPPPPPAPEPAKRPSSASASPSTPAPPQKEPIVYMSGYVAHRGRVTVYLSDGRTLVEDDLDYVERRYARTPDGKRYFSLRPQFAGVVGAGVESTPDKAGDKTPSTPTAPVRDAVRSSPALVGGP